MNVTLLNAMGGMHVKLLGWIKEFFKLLGWIKEVNWLTMGSETALFEC